MSARWRTSFSPGSRKRVVLTKIVRKPWAKESTTTTAPTTTPAPPTRRSTSVPAFLQSSTTTAEAAAAPETTTTLKVDPFFPFSTAKPVIKFTSGVPAETGAPSQQPELPVTESYGISTTFVPVAAEKVALVDEELAADHFEPTTTHQGLDRDYEEEYDASTIPPTSFVTR